MISKAPGRRRKAPNKTALDNLTQSVSSTLKNVMSAGKKDDDLFSNNDIQRGNRNKSLLKILANTNPLFLLIGAGFCVVGFIITAIFVFTALFGSNTSDVDLRQFHRRGHRYPPAKNRAPFPTKGNPRTARREIQTLVTEMRRAKDDIEANIFNDWDQRTSELMQKFCLDELAFEMDGEAKNTFDAHVSFIFESIVERDPFVYLSAHETVVTEFGTLNTKDDLATYAQDVSIKNEACTFVTVLLQIADEDGLMTGQPAWDQNGESNDFAKTNDEVWKAHKGQFNRKQVNEAAYSLIALATGSSHDIHLAKQMMPNLLQTHCPMIKTFYKNKYSDDKESVDNALFEVVNSVEDLLTQLHHHGRIHVEKNESPVFDENGYLVAVDKFSLNNDNKKFEDSWISCNFVDKLVYYHYATLTEQAQTVLKLITDFDFYALENLFDMLMLQHCPLTVRTLSEKKLDDEHSDVYQSKFRAELSELAFKFRNSERVLHVGEPHTLVVVNNGAITHRWSEVAKREGYTQCPIINELAALANKQNANAKTNEFNEEMFDPKSDFKWWKSLHKGKHSVEEDAQTLLGYQNDGDMYELTRYTLDLLNSYHGKDIGKWNNEQKERVVSETVQYIHTLVNIDGPATWPSSTHAVLDIDNVQLTILNEGDDTLKSGTKVKSELFTKLFALALTQKA